MIYCLWGCLMGCFAFLKVFKFPNNFFFFKFLCNKLVLDLFFFFPIAFPFSDGLHGKSDRKGPKQQNPDGASGKRQFPASQNPPWSYP